MGGNLDFEISTRTKSAGSEWRFNSKINILIFLVSSGVRPS